MRVAFTLVELLIVVLIIGILAMISMPLYRKTIETSKATNAASIANMIANANRMYFLDNNTYLAGVINDSCNSLSCSNASGACRLVACGYLAKQRWSEYQWTFCACDMGNCSCPGGCGGSNAISCATNYLSPVGHPYTTWRYQIDSNGSCMAFGTQVPSCPRL